MLQLFITQQYDLLQLDQQSAQMLNQYPLTYSLFFTSDKCRTCDGDQQEIEDAYEQLHDILDIYQVNCDEQIYQQICKQFKIQKYPQLLVINHNKDSPAPVEYFGDYDSDKVQNFLEELIREPFIHSTETQATIDFMMKQCQKGIFFFFFTTQKQAPKYLYQLGKQNFGKANIVVQTNFDRKAYDDLEIVTFQDRLSYGEDNLFAAIDGVMQFFPLEVNLQDHEFIDQWMEEILIYAQQQRQQQFSQQQFQDDFDDDY